GRRGGGRGRRGGRSDWVRDQSWACSTNHPEIDGACGGGRPEGGEMLSSIHGARPPVSPAASARIIAVTAAGDTSKSIPLSPRNTRMGVKSALLLPSTTG